MTITISGRHLDITDSIRAAIEEKLDHALKVFPRVVRATRVVVTLDNYLFNIEALVELTTHKTITTNVSGKDFLTVVEQLAHKINEQLRRLKERIESHHKRFKTPRAARTAAPEPEE